MTTPSEARSEASRILAEIAERAREVETFEEWEELVDSLPGSGGKLARFLVYDESLDLGGSRLGVALGEDRENFKTLAAAGRRVASHDDLERMAAELGPSMAVVTSVEKKVDPYWYWNARFLFDLQMDQVKIRVLAGLDPEHLTLDMLKTPEELMDLANRMLGWAVHGLSLVKQRRSPLEHGIADLEKVAKHLDASSDHIAELKDLIDRESEPVNGGLEVPDPEVSDDDARPAEM